VTDPGQAVRDREEIAAAIRSLTDDDWFRLHKVALSYASLYGLDKDDLVHDAIVRALDGSRNCPVSVDIVYFLKEAIRSIADGAAQKKRRRREVRLPDYDDPANALPEPADPSPDAEAELIAEEEAARRSAEIADLLSDDIEAQTIAEGILDGMRGEELRALTDLDETGYASKRRLIRRRFEKRKGGKS
jgi:RNA polymerase sigma-70 factor (ECF subfamily)